MAPKIWQYFFKILLRNPSQNTCILVGYGLKFGIWGLVDQASFLSHEVKTDEPWLVQQWVNNVRLLTNFLTIDFVWQLNELSVRIARQVWIVTQETIEVGTVHFATKVIEASLQPKKHSVWQSQMHSSGGPGKFNQSDGWLLNSILRTHWKILPRIVS